MHVPQVQTLSLAKNNLAGVHLQSLSQYLPKLANLSLQDNRIRTWKDIDFISARKGKLLHLRELVLLGNPIRDTVVQEGGIEKYKQCVKRATLLTLLDHPTLCLGKLANAFPR
jgi:nuclear RNA export factor